MLINALNDYYDILVEQDLILPEQYQNVDIDYMVVLTPEGKAVRIIDERTFKKVSTKGDKEKTVIIRKSVKLPKRSQKTSIDSNIVEHRPLYIFGLEYDSKQCKLYYEQGNKADKSHRAFKDASEEFFKDIDSPVAKAFYEFVVNWNPEEETENPVLSGLGKDYGKSYFTFCLEGDLTHPLQDDAEVRKKWEEFYEKRKAEDKDTITGQCSISGKDNIKIARIHDKINGLVAAGGHSTGCVLVGYKENAYCSYGDENSYNSKVSTEVMQHYTKSMNYLLQSKQNHINFDQTMVMYWTEDGNKNADSWMSILTKGSQKEDEGKALQNLMKYTKEGTLTAEKIEEEMEGVDPDAMFYIIGMKPNGPRIALKFLYQKKYGNVIQNVIKHQIDLQVMENDNEVKLFDIKGQLISPKPSKSNVDSHLMEGILTSMFLGTEYPTELLQTVLQRVRKDVGVNNNRRVRAGIIKACVNRHERRYKKEEVSVGLNKESTSEAYLCGRLFAALQKAQEESASGKLNRTIKDAYFSSASVKPATVFPELLRLSQLI